jgi:hypothetical protein
MNGSRYLKSGYWQVKLDKQSIPKTAFTTTNGNFEFLRTPFEIRNAPAQFSRLMVNLFGQFSFVSVKTRFSCLKRKSLNIQSLNNLILINNLYYIVTHLGMLLVLF